MAQREFYKVYRVEDPAGMHGLWRDFDGTVNPVFSKLTVGKFRNMPMEDSDFYLYGGKRWFASTDSPEKLSAWFDIEDILELEKMGYHAYEFDVTEIRTVSPYEVVFTRDSILRVTVLSPEDMASIWPEYKSTCSTS